MGLSGDFGLLHAVDERLAAYGFETNTGVKFIVVVDMRGRRVDGSVVAGLVDKDKSKGATAVGLRDGELKPVRLPAFGPFPSLCLPLTDGRVQIFKAMQNSYVQLLQNPFYDPDEHSPPSGRGGKKISSKNFTDDIRRIGETWTPGVTNL
jgi:trafficking protein particle complex subunit 2